jgi:hypothetical protein
MGKTLEMRKEANWKEKKCLWRGLAVEPRFL